jgi:hypothetical protein
MSTSFISEHTAEFILVPKMIDILAQRFAKVIPLYFLSTREGGRISRDCDQSLPIRVLNVFARRPKVYVPNNPRIEVKFNSTLFQKVDLAAQVGIPTLAGVPLASSLMELGLDTRCAWFSLSGILNEDVYYNLLLDGTVDDQSYKSPGIAGPLQDHEIIETVLERSRPMIWSEAIDHLKLIRRCAPDQEDYWLFFGRGYHPFSLLLIEETNQTR